MCFMERFRKKLFMGKFWRNLVGILLGSQIKQIVSKQTVVPHLKGYTGKNKEDIILWGKSWVKFHRIYKYKELKKMILRVTLIAGVSKCSTNALTLCAASCERSSATIKSLSRNSIFRRCKIIKLLPSIPYKLLKSWMIMFSASEVYSVSYSN